MVFIIVPQTHLGCNECCKLSGVKTFIFIQHFTSKQEQIWFTKLSILWNLWILLQNSIVFFFQIHAFQLTFSPQPQIFLPKTHQQHCLIFVMQKTSVLVPSHQAMLEYQLWKWLKKGLDTEISFQYEFNYWQTNFHYCTIIQ